MSKASPYTCYVIVPVGVVHPQEDTQSCVIFVSVLYVVHTVHFMRYTQLYMVY